MIKQCFYPILPIAKFISLVRIGRCKIFNISCKIKITVVYSECGNVILRTGRNSKILFDFGFGAIFPEIMNRFKRGRRYPKACGNIYVVVLLSDFKRHKVFATGKICFNVVFPIAGFAVFSSGKKGMQHGISPTHRL